MTISMSSSIRHLDDSGTTTLLTLPLSDFSKNAATDDNEEDSDDLVLVSLSNNADSGGLTMNDLLNSQNNSVYILGDTSESDIAHSVNAPSNHNNPHQRQGEDEEGGNQYSSSFEPVAARLIVEPTGNDDSKRQAKTLDLVRVETSNTYIVTPPMAIDKNNGSDDQQGDSKRQKLSATTGLPATTKQLVTMPARSIGVVPGENSPSCFFLDPMVLPQGHFANKLRTALGRWVYNPLEPPSASSPFGYTTRELAHICRSSLSEIEYALSNRVYGAEDALVVPDGAAVTRYGMLSEEGRQTVAMAIVSTLLESDLDLVWASSNNNMDDKAMELSPLMQEVRSNWQREEGADNELADEVIWHGLRSIVSYNSNDSKDEIPKQVQLIVEEVAKLAAHHVFLRGTPRSAGGWEEDEFMEAWLVRLPTMTDKSYQPSMDLLGGIAISEMVEDKRQWRYFPASGLPSTPSLRIKSMLAMRSTWTAEEAKPYFEKLTMDESEVVSLLKIHKK